MWQQRRVARTGRKGHRILRDKRTIKWRILITHTLITKRLKQWRLLCSELNTREQYEQFLELVKADLDERKQLFMGRPAYLYWSEANQLE